MIADQTKKFKRWGVKAGMGDYIIKHRLVPVAPLRLLLYSNPPPENTYML